MPAVATRCVEAGVDLELPAVLRSFGPLDCVAQAVGRCNRNGNRQSRRCLGIRSRGIRPDDPTGPRAEPPMVTAELLAGVGARWISTYRRCSTTTFDPLYNLSRPESRSQELLQAIKLLDFRRVAELYRIIDDNSISIVTPWSLDQFTRLASEVRDGRLTRSWIERARSLTVSVFRPRPDSSDWTHLEPVSYRPKQGFRRLVSFEGPQ